MLEFVEMTAFRRRCELFLDQEALRKLQLVLVGQPELGVLIPDTGGLRKLRWGDKSRGKGKRGGCRIIYLYHPEMERLDLLAIYGKDEQDDLTASDKKQLKLLAELARSEAVKRQRKRKK